MKTIWRLRTPDEHLVKRLQAALGCHSATACLLVHRDLHSPAEAERFLRPTLRHLRQPFEIKDLDRAARRICGAIVQHQKIWIFGDYDADGVTATVLLYQFLQRVGADVSYTLPHRVVDGYGLKPHHISDIAIPNRIDVAITVDCGSSSHAAVSLAREAGIDVIITDHHEPPDPLPPAWAVVNPKRRDCGAGFQDLAGVGVAFFLVAGIRKELRDQGFWKNRKEPNLKKRCDLVALGTVADMVPLVGDNRILTQIGLEVLRNGCRIGSDSLIRVSGIDKKSVASEDIAFRIAPRINAAGRMEHADIAARLLTAGDAKTASQAADQLNHYNVLRQAEEKKTLDDILNRLEKKPDLIFSKSIVLAGGGWHEGILGIIASRVLKLYYRPVIVFSVNGKVAKGSGRSVAGLNLYRAVTACEDLLLQFGGHAMAVGLQLPAHRIDAFRKRLEQVVIEMTGPNAFVPEMAIDLELPLSAISPALADEIERLKPFGNQNPEPLLLARDVHVLSSTVVGGSHRRMVLSQSSDGSCGRIAAIQFNADAASLQCDHFGEMIYRIRWNRWNGNQSLQLTVEGFRSPDSDSAKRVS